jgi:hypothetical protein
MAAYRGAVAKKAIEHEKADDDQPVYLVTSARTSHSQEMSGRLRRYLISMSVRVVCLALAIFVFNGWLRLIGIAAAVILPWVAVVLANAGPVDDGDQPEFIVPSHVEIEPRSPKESL